MRLFGFTGARERLLTVTAQLAARANGKHAKAGAKTVGAG
jgi:hypothetical protein